MTVNLREVGVSSFVLYGQWSDLPYGKGANDAHEPPGNILLL